MSYKKRTKVQMDLLIADLEEYLKQNKDEDRNALKTLRNYHLKKGHMEQEGRLYKTWETSAFNKETQKWETATNHGYDYSPVPEEQVDDLFPVSYTHLTLPTIALLCRSRWSPYH